MDISESGGVLLSCDCCETSEIKQISVKRKTDVKFIRTCNIKGILFKPSQAGEGGILLSIIFKPNNKE